MMRILISVLLFFCCASVKAQQTFLSAGELPLGIQVKDRGGNDYNILSYCDGFDEDGLPINLIIPHDAIIIFFLPTITVENSEGYSFATRTDSKPKSVKNFVHDYEGKKVSLLGAISHSPGSKGSIRVNYKKGNQSIELIDLQYGIDYESPAVDEVLLGSELVELLKESYGKDIFDVTTRKYDVWQEKGYSSTGGTTIPTDLVLPQHENSIYINITGNYDVTELIIERNGKLMGFEDSYMLYNWFMGLTDLKPGDYKLTVVNDQKAYGDKSDTFEFTIEQDFWKTWGYWLVAALIVTLVAFVGYRINTRRKLKSADLLKQLSEAELKAIRSQLNPHFLFNALNAIQNLVNKNDTEKANEYIVKLSRLMRTVLSQSDETLHAIVDEIQLSKLYLSLENMRTPFQFDIELADSLNQNLLVPTMILQPYLENAVLHGVGNGKATRVTVKIFEDKGYLVLEVRDNGQHQSTIINEGRGMSLGRERIEIIKKQLGSDAKVGVQSSASLAQGFVVTIQLPTNL